MNILNVETTPKYYYKNYCYCCVAFLGRITAIHSKHFVLLRVKQMFHENSIKTCFNNTCVYNNENSDLLSYSHHFYAMDDTNLIQLPKELYGKRLQND